MHANPFANLLHLCGTGHYNGSSSHKFSILNVYHILEWCRKEICDVRSILPKRFLCCGFWRIIHRVQLLSHRCTHRVVQLQPHCVGFYLAGAYYQLLTRWKKENLRTSNIKELRALK